MKDACCMRIETKKMDKEQFDKLEVFNPETGLGKFNIFDEGKTKVQLAFVQDEETKKTYCFFKTPRMKKFAFVAHVGMKRKGFFYLFEEKGGKKSETYTACDISKKDLTNVGKEVAEKVEEIFKQEQFKDKAKNDPVWQRINQKENNKTTILRIKDEITEEQLKQINKIIKGEINQLEHQPGITITIVGDFDLLLIEKIRKIEGLEKAEIEIVEQEQKQIFIKEEKNMAKVVKKDAEKGKSAKKVSANLTKDAEELKQIDEELEKLPSKKVSKSANSAKTLKDRENFKAQVQGIIDGVKIPFRFKDSESFDAHATAIVDEVAHDFDSHVVQENRKDFIDFAKACIRSREDTYIGKSSNEISNEFKKEIADYVARNIKFSRKDEDRTKPYSEQEKQIVRQKAKIVVNKCALSKSDIERKYLTNQGKVDLLQKFIPYAESKIFEKTPILKPTIIKTLDELKQQIAERIEKGQSLSFVERIIDGKEVYSLDTNRGSGYDFGFSGRFLVADGKNSKNYMLSSNDIRDFKVKVKVKNAAGQNETKLVDSVYQKQGLALPFALATVDHVLSKAQDKLNIETVEEYKQLYTELQKFAQETIENYVYNDNDKRILEEDRKMRESFTSPLWIHRRKVEEIVGKLVEIDEYEDRVVEADQLTKKFCKEINDQNVKDWRKIFLSQAQEQKFADSAVVGIDNVLNNVAENEKSAEKSGVIAEGADQEMTEEADEKPFDLFDYAEEKNNNEANEGVRKENVKTSNPFAEFIDSEEFAIAEPVEKEVEENKGIIEVDPEKIIEAETKPVSSNGTDNIYSGLPQSPTEKELAEVEKEIANLNKKETLKNKQVPMIKIEVKGKKRGKDTAAAYLVIGPHPNKTGETSVYYFEGEPKDSINYNDAKTMIENGGKPVNKLFVDNKRDSFNLAYYKNESQIAHDIVGSKNASKIAKWLETNDKQHKVKDMNIVKRALVGLKLGSKSVIAKFATIVAASVLLIGSVVGGHVGAALAQDDNSRNAGVDVAKNAIEIVLDEKTETKDLFAYDKLNGNKLVGCAKDFEDILKAREGKSEHLWGRHNASNKKARLEGFAETLGQQAVEELNGKYNISVGEFNRDTQERIVNFVYPQAPEAGTSRDREASKTYLQTIGYSEADAETFLSSWEKGFRDAAINRIVTITGTFDEALNNHYQNFEDAVKKAIKQDKVDILYADSNVVFAQNGENLFKLDVPSETNDNLSLDERVKNFIERVEISGVTKAKNVKEVFAGAFMEDEGLRTELDDNLEKISNTFVSNYAVINKDADGSYVQPVQYVLVEKDGKITVSEQKMYKVYLDNKDASRTNASALSLGLVSFAPGYSKAMTLDEAKVTYENNNLENGTITVETDKTAEQTSVRNSFNLHFDRGL